MVGTTPRRKLFHGPKYFAIASQTVPYDSTLAYTWQQANRHLLIGGDLLDVGLNHTRGNTLEYPILTHIHDEINYI